MDENTKEWTIKEVLKEFTSAGKTFALATVTDEWRHYGSELMQYQLDEESYRELFLTFRQVALILEEQTAHRKWWYAKLADLLYLAVYQRTDFLTGVYDFYNVFAPDVKILFSLIGIHVGAGEYEASWQTLTQQLPGCAEMTWKKVAEEFHDWCE